MILSKYAKLAEKIVADNSPTILTAVGVVGTVGTAILTGKATLKSTQLIRDEKFNRFLETPEYMPGEEDIPPLDKVGVVKLVWKEYIPPVGSGALTVACIICANRISTRRAAAMAVAYSLSEKSIKEYKEKIQEKFGLNKSQQVKDEVAQDRVRENPNKGMVVVGPGNVLCYDEISGRYFESSMEDIKKAQNDTNYEILHSSYASLSDFYYRLGLPPTKYSEEVGWNTDHLLEISFSTVLADDQRPCLSLEYNVVPSRGYNHLG